MGLLGGLFKVQAACNSKARKTSIVDLNDLYEFLKNEVPCNELLANRGCSASTFHKDRVRFVLSGFDLWNHDSAAVSVSIKDHTVLTKYGSHPSSTQHNKNERRGKMSSQIARTNMEDRAECIIT